MPGGRSRRPMNARPSSSVLIQHSPELRRKEGEQKTLATADQHSQSGGVRRFGHVITTDGVLGTHSGRQSAYHAICKSLGNLAGRDALLIDTTDVAHAD